MTAVPSAGAGGGGDRISPRAWLIIALLFFAQCLNSLDRMVIGLVSVPLMTDMHLAPTQFGALASSFYSLYALSGVLCAALLSWRLSSKWLLVILTVTWSVAQFPAALATSVGMLFFGRVLLGIGEGPASPAIANAAYGWFPSSKRGVPTAITVAGLSIGGLVGAPALTALILHFGWRSAFLACAVLGLAWVAAWVALGKDGPYAVPARKPGVARVAEPVPARTFWTDPTILASFLCGFAAYWVSGFTFAWANPYLRIALGASASDAGALTGLISAVPTLFVVAAPLIGQLLMTRGVSARLSWGVQNGVLLLISAAGYLGATIVPGVALKVACLAVAGGAAFATFVLGPLIVSHMASPSRRAVALPLIYSGVSIAGLISPIVFGRLIEIGGGGVAGYDLGLLSNAVVALVAGVVGLFLLNPDRSLVRLNREETSHDAA